MEAFLEFLVHQALEEVVEYQEDRRTLEAAVRQGEAVEAAEVYHLVCQAHQAWEGAEEYLMRILADQGAVAGEVVCLRQEGQMERLNRH